MLAINGTLPQRACVKLARLLVTVTLLAAFDSRAALEFSGYLKSKEETRFVLTDLETGKSSGWLAVGDSFGGYVVAAFMGEVLTVEREGTKTRLPLKADRVKDGTATAPPAQVQLSQAADPIRINTTSNGKIFLNGKQFSLEDLEKFFRIAAKTDGPLVLEIHEPPSPNQKSHEATKSIGQSLKSSGAKKWTLKIVDAAPERAPAK